MNRPDTACSLPKSADLHSPAVLPRRAPPGNFPGGRRSAMSSCKGGRVAASAAKGGAMTPSVTVARPGLAPGRTAFLFDLDGTLVDSVYQHVLAWHEAMAAVGIE